MFSEEFQKIVEFRRSNRAYDSEIDVEDEVIEKSIKRAILAPNSSNLQLWEFHWIKSQQEFDSSIKGSVYLTCLLYTSPSPRD